MPPFWISLEQGYIGQNQLKTYLKDQYDESSNFVGVLMLLGMVTTSSLDFKVHCN